MDKIAVYVLAGMCIMAGGYGAHLNREDWVLPVMFGFVLALAASGVTLINFKA